MLKINFNTGVRVIIFALLSLFISQGCAAVSEEALTPDQVAREFYHEYLIAWDLPVQESIEKSSALMDKYTTRHFQSAISNNETGADYVTDSQEICPAWVSNISISYIDTKGNKSYVIVTLGADKSFSSYGVDLVKEDNQWRLQSIKLIERSSSFCN
jgi:hypothetical protein